LKETFFASSSSKHFQDVQHVAKLGVWPSA